MLPTSIFLASRTPEGVLGILIGLVICAMAAIAYGIILLFNWMKKRK